MMEIYVGDNDQFWLQRLLFGVIMFSVGSYIWWLFGNFPQINLATLLQIQLA